MFSTIALRNCQAMKACHPPREEFAFMAFSFVANRVRLAALNQLSETNIGTYNMHISEGVLSPAVLAGGAALAAAGTALGLKKMDYEAIPRVAILSAAFFVATLIHVPVGPVGLHLVLNGLMGLLLGWLAVPAILIALFLQALLFQFGGLTVLGVNTVIMALPAVVCFYLFRPFLRRQGTLAAIAAFGCGFTAILLGGLLIAVALLGTGQAFLQVAELAVLAHIPLMIIEGIITLLVFLFIEKVRPEMLEGIYA
jgi:cobalt/nickel transport system permease protein